MELSQDNNDLIEKFGATPINKLSETPDFYTFNNGLIASYRDFDIFFKAIKNKEKCAIVSGLNASGTLHLGHKVVFDTNLFFQKKYKIPVYIPISDDESYVAGKVKTQEQALENSKRLAKELISYGFDPKNTFFIIDQIYTNIYNLAIKLSKKVNYSEIKATYGYKPDENIGLHFYPAVQSAHIIFPQEQYKIPNVLVPIGPDEDAHIRISRDIASRAGYKKPSILHVKFLPGIDGKKMSTSKPNTAIFLNDDEKTIRKKISRAFSGGQKTIEEHKRLGGNPEVDISCIYLKALFLKPEEYNKIETKYKKGELLSNDIKQMFADETVKFIKQFQTNLKKTSDKTVDNCVLKN